MKTIEFKNITFAYPKSEPIIQDFSISFEKNKIYAIVGKNGVGKTTIGKLAVKLLDANNGQILINAKDVKSMSLAEIGKRVAYVYQEVSRQLFASSVYEELSFPMELKNCENIKETVEKQLKKFDLLHLKDEFPFYLSQGEKQRLVIAGALLENPDFIILDEPTTALDSKRKNELSKILLKLKNETEIGIIIISHDFEFLEKLSCEEVKIEK